MSFAALPIRPSAQTASTISTSTLPVSTASYPIISQNAHVKDFLSSKIKLKKLAKNAATPQQTNVKIAKVFNTPLLANNVSTV